MTDKQSIDLIIEQFFNLFTTSKSNQVNLEKIYTLCIREAVITKNVQGNTEIYNLDEFVKPREKLLNDGTLIDFSEREVNGETKIFGHIAQRFCQYNKSGSLNGEAFDTSGMKTFQFIKVSNEWKISAMAWDDD